MRYKVTYGFRPKYGNMRAGTPYFQKKHATCMHVPVRLDWGKLRKRGAVVLAAAWCLQLLSGLMGAARAKSELVKVLERGPRWNIVGVAS